MIVRMLCLTTFTALLGIAPAQAEPGSPAEPVGMYYVPEAFRDQARQLVDPGPKGLPGGLALAELELGTEITATFRGEAGEFKVSVLPAATAEEPWIWKGERVALRAVSSTLSEADTQEALARLETLLKRREAGWGWFHRPRPVQEDTAEQDASRSALLSLRRRVLVGMDGPAAVDALNRWREDHLPNFHFTIIAAQVALRAGEEAGSRELAAGAVELGMKALSQDTLTREREGSLRIALASALALAGRIEDAQNVAQVVIDKGHGVCNLSATLGTLLLVGRGTEAQILANQILKTHSACHDVSARRIDAARVLGDLKRGRALARSSRELAKTSLTVLAAQTRLELVAGDLTEALGAATVLARHGRGEGEGLLLLASVAAHGLVSDAELETWAGRAARHPRDPGRLQQGVVSHWISGRDDKALKALEALAEARVRAPAMAGLKAVILARKGDAAAARAVLDTAWLSAKTGPAEVGAEAVVMTALGDGTGAARAWRAYLRALDTDGPGPWTREQAQERLASLVAGTPEPAGEGTSVPSGFPWVWLLVAVAAIGGALLLRGRGSAAQAES